MGWIVVHFATYRTNRASRPILYMYMYECVIPVTKYITLVAMCHTIVILSTPGPQFGPLLKCVRRYKTHPHNTPVHFFYRGRDFKAVAFCCKCLLTTSLLLSTALVWCGSNPIHTCSRWNPPTLSL